MTMSCVRDPGIKQKEVSLISLKSMLKGNAIAETTYFPIYLNETRKLNQRSTDGKFVFHISYKTRGLIIAVSRPRFFTAAV